jgi:hypothetical protein
VSDELDNITDRWDSLTLEDLKKDRSRVPLPDLSWTMILQKVEPKQGDIVILAIKEPVPEKQLRAFRLGLYSFTEEHFQKTGVRFTFLVVNTEIDVQHLSPAQVKEVLHENMVVPREDGTLIETIRAIGQEE